MQLFKHSLIFLFTLSLSFVGFGQDTLDLATAAQEAKIKIVKLSCLGGFQGERMSLTLTSKAPRKFVLRIPAGHVFASVDPDEQDLMHTQELFVALKPNNTKPLKLFTMCTQANNMAPASGSGFQLGAMATGGLLSIAQAIAADDYQSSTAQSAVWAVSSNRPLGDIYARDTAVARRLAIAAANALNVPLPKINFTPKAHQITAIRTSLEALPQTYIKKGRLVAEDSSGRVGMTYFEDKRIAPGFWHFRLGLNHTRIPESAFWLRLYDGETLIAERKVTRNDTVTPVQDIRTTVKMSYEVDQTQPVSVGLYDATGQVYMYLSEKSIISQGTHNSTFQIGKTLPVGVPLQLHVKDTLGVSLAVGAVDPNKPMEILLPPITRRGLIDFMLDERIEGASLGIYKENGDLVRYLFTNGRLNSGMKKYNYKFTHREGPEAKFQVKLIGGNEEVKYEAWLE